MSRTPILKTGVSALVIAAMLAASAAPAFARAAPAAPSPATAPAAPQTEDARLAAFFQQAFMEAIAQTPEGLTQIGSKERYGELGD